MTFIKHTRDAGRGRAGPLRRLRRPGPGDGAGHHRLVCRRQHRPHAGHHRRRRGSPAAWRARAWPRPASTTTTATTAASSSAATSSTANFGLEFGYFDLGKFGYKATTAPAGSLTGDMRVKGWNADLVGTLPLVGKLSALGRVGVTPSRAEDQFSSTGAARVPYCQFQPSQRSNGDQVRRRPDVRLHRTLSMRVEGERYRLKDAVGNRGDVDMLSVGLVYRFGGSPAPRHRGRRPERRAARGATGAAVAPPCCPPRLPRRTGTGAGGAHARQPLGGLAVRLRPVRHQAGRPGSLDKMAADLRGLNYDSRCKSPGTPIAWARRSYNTRFRPGAPRR